MKYFKSFLAIGLGIWALACSEDDKLTVQVQDDVERGAVLRTIATPNPTFDFNDPSKEWAVELEEQDHEDGALFSAVDVYVSHTVAATGNSSDEALVKTIAASEFSTGPNDLPRGIVSTSLTEVLSALGLQAGDYESTDFFRIRLELVLNDGRTFSEASAGATVAGGSFFRSPYVYSAQFFCALADASAFDGNYVVVTDAWADYAAGDVIPVEFVAGYTFRILNSVNPFVANPGTSYMEVTIDPTDGSVTVASNECFDYPGFDCIDVTGSGTIGTCTGDINLNNVFGPYGTYGFTLVKQ